MKKPGFLEYNSQGVNRGVWVNIDDKFHRNTCNTLGHGNTELLRPHYHIKWM